MDVKYLNYILEMANQKSITKAANALFVSQPSLSQYLSRLEAELETPLFIRTKNELLPTPAGELYIEAARNVIHIQKQLYRNIATLSQTGQIRVGISSQWALDVLTDILPVFQEAYPHITIKIYQNKYDSMVHLLNSGKLDLAVMAATNLEEFPYEHELLRKEEILFAIPQMHHLAGNFKPGQVISLEEITSVFQNESFVLSDEGSTLRTVIDQIFHRYHFAPLSCCEINSNSVMQSLVSRNMGVSFIPISYSHKTTGIDYYHMDPPVFRYNIIAHRKNSIFSEIDHHFMKLIKEHPMFRNTEDEQML
ncbi:MAG: LysR family transcriptional regulator [Lachnospiraceae bacterium]|nr:LysR family transcriptional regulator [Lachnospiraceae bacterium]